MSDLKSSLKDNELVFKTMAITFSLEGNNKELQEVLQKNSDYNIKVLSELSSALQHKLVYKNKQIIKKLSDLISYVADDTKVILGSYNIILQDLINKNKSLIDELKSGK